MNRDEKIAKIKEGKFFVRGDAIVFAVCLLLVALFTFFAFGSKRAEGEYIEILAYGETIAELPLDEDAVYLYSAAGGGSITRVMDDSLLGDWSKGNLIVVEGGKVRVDEADCPDQTCVLTGARGEGEIICMPHGLTVKIVGGLGSDA